jgi:hypothetical protein
MHRVGVGDNHRIPKEQKYDAMNLFARLLLVQDSRLEGLNGGD